MTPDAERRRVRTPDVATSRNKFASDGTSDEWYEEVTGRIEAASTAATFILTGELDTELGLGCIVRLLEHARRHLQVAA